LIVTKTKQLLTIENTQQTFMAQKQSSF